MASLHRETAFLFFVCGLAWLSIALGMALLRRRSPRPSWWLVACFALQGAAAWAGAMAACEAAAASGRWHAATGAGQTTVLVMMRLAMLIGSLVALVEYGQTSLARHRARLPGRWIYAILAAWTAIGPFVVERGWLEFGVRALLAWPGTIVPALFLLALTKRDRLARRGFLAIALVMLLAAALAGCLPLGVGQPALALLAAVATWRVFCRRAQAQAAPIRRAPVWRRAAAPAAFLLALAAGWFAIVGQHSPRAGVTAREPQEIVNLIDQIEREAPPKPSGKLDRQLERFGLAVAPILALVLGVWGLSRLPFAR